MPGYIRRTVAICEACHCPEYNWIPVADGKEGWYAIHSCLMTATYKDNNYFPRQRFERMKVPDLCPNMLEYAVLCQPPTEN